MLLMTLELVNGYTGKRTTLAEAQIWNDESGDAFTGNYGVRVEKLDLKPEDNKPTRASIKQFARTRFNALELLTRALLALGYGKDK